MVTVATITIFMRDTNTPAPPALTHIREYYPADATDADMPEAYLAGYATCEVCDGRDWVTRSKCPNCRRGDVRVELSGAPAEAAYQAWAAKDNDDYSIASGYHFGAVERSATGWATFLPMAAAFMAKHGPCSMSNDSTNDGEPGSGMLNWQTDMVECMASELRSAKAVAA